MRPKNRTLSVSATDIGSACFCPHSLELRLANKTETKTAKLNKQRGTFLHGVQNEHAYSRSIEIANASSDKRCYIATHLYGQDHPKTQYLRDFRDRHLLPSLPGRIITSLYYRISPSLVRVCSRYSYINTIVSALVTTALFFIEKLSRHE